MAHYLYASEDVFTPPSILEQGDGSRPAFERLLELIDTTDDAWPATAGVLREMMLAGVELDETAVTIAVKLARKRWDQTVTALPSLRRERITLASASTAIVYYIRRGDLIKIGTTTDPVDRFTSLLPDEILAFEPGSYADETFRHHQFGHLRCQGEHFAPEPELMAHIQHIRNLYGEPDPAWPTVAHLGKERREILPPASGETMTMPDAAAVLGIKESTLRGWVHRGRIGPVGRDEQGRQLYYVDHLKLLRDNPRARIRRTGRDICQEAG